MIVRLIFIYLFCLSNLLVFGQFTYPPYKQYTVRDGLAQMQVWCLHQDSRGYIWIGTKGGLSRFDGEKFTSYTVKDGLIDNFVIEVFEDHSGNICVLSQIGLSVFDGVKFKSYPFPERAWNIKATAGPDGKIWCIGHTSNFKLIFGYFDHGNFISQSERYTGLIADYLSRIHYSKERQSLLIINNRRLLEIKNETITLHRKFIENIDFAFQDSSLMIYEWDRQKNNRLYEFRNGIITKVAEVRQGILQEGNKISRTFSFFPVRDEFVDQVLTISPKTLEIFKIESQINSFLVDKENKLWIGTEEGLLQAFDGSFQTYKREFLPMIWSIVEDRAENIWFASFNFGLCKYDGKSFHTYSADDLKDWAINFYFQPHVDKNGVIYFPNGKGILFYKDGSFSSLPAGICMSTFYDHERELLFSGHHLQVNVYDLKQRLIQSIGKSDGLEINGFFGSLGKDRLGYLWFGGRTGLVRYNWETKKVSNYNQANGKLPSDGVLCIYTIPGGTTWFGGEQGLLWYDEKNDSIRKVEHEELTESVSLISSIDSTWLVLSQPSGIYLMDLKKFKREGKVDLHLFNEQNGFMGLEPGQNGAMKDSKGNIWMTTSTEVVKLDPSKLNFSEHQVDVRISGFNGLPLSYQQKEIVLPKNDRTAVLQFEAICFNRPKPVLYSWRVDGEKDWSPWQKENYAVITDLHDGKEIIQVRVKIPGLPKAEAVTQIPLFVNLALWKQAWFFPTLLGVVSFFVILALLILFQTRAKMVQINRQAKMFQLQAILSQMNPHFIFNVMASLQSMIITANLEKANEYLVKMSNLVRGFLDASVSTTLSKTKQLKEGELPLSKELEILQNFIQFQQLIYPEKFDYELQVDEGIDPNQCTIPPMLIQPFVENAIRHGLLQKEEKGLLLVRIFRSVDKLLQVEIVDDGIGMRKAGEMIRQSHLLYTSRGKELTEKRIKLLNEMGYHIQLDIQSSDQGTHVTIKIDHDDKV